jgi:hypothetical protein
MKKCISCLLAALLTCRCIPSSAWTETAAAEDNTPLIAAAEISAEPGETVTVPLTVLHNPGIAALSLSITYDASMLTLLDAQSKAEWNTAVFLAGGIEVLSDLRYPRADIRCRILLSITDANASAYVERVYLEPKFISRFSGIRYEDLSLAVE